MNTPETETITFLFVNGVNVGGTRSPKELENWIFNEISRGTPSSKLKIEIRKDELGSAKAHNFKIH